MSNSTDPAKVKENQRGKIEFFLLKTVNRLSPPYPVNSLESIDFIDALVGNGWGEQYLSEKTVIFTAPADSNILIFTPRNGVAS